MQGLDAGIRARFDEWAVTVEELYITAQESLPAPDHAQALRITMLQLASIQPRDADSRVSLRGWVWTAQMAQWAADMLPALPQYHYRVVCEQLNDPLLQMADTLSARMCGIAVQRLQVQQDHSAKAWALPVFEVAHCSAADLVKLPHTSEEGGLHHVCILRFNIEADVLQVSIRGILARTLCLPA